MKPNKKIFIAGHNGMVGSCIKNKLSKDLCNEIITKSRNELDLTNQQDVNSFFEKNKPDQVYIAAAKVGGINANNTLPAEFIYKNLMIQSNIINAAYNNNVERLLFLGSSCIYPRMANQPMHENELLSGYLEPTNEPYAIAKIAGIKLCESYNRQYGCDFRSIMPTNLYGPGDSYHKDNSHVIPALIWKFHQAKIHNKSSVTVWGSGMPLREFLFVSDMADASVFIMSLNKDSYNLEVDKRVSHINVGSGFEISIKNLAKLISRVTEYKGKITFDKTKPDGPPRKFLDSTKLNDLGWYPKVTLETGLMMAYKDYKISLKKESNEK